MSAHPPKPWQKLLYIKQDYPDNYVDASFLEHLRMNNTTTKDRYWDIVLHTTTIMQHASSIAIFVAVFEALYTNAVHPRALLTVMMGLTLTGFVFWKQMLQSRIPSLQSIQWFGLAKRAVLLFGILLGLSPILKTLTRDISADTIWALATCLLLINLLFQDYRLSPAITISLSGPIAMNAAIFASVVLASRLTTTIHAFALMLFSIICIDIKKQWLSMHYSVGFHCILFIVALVQLWHISAAVSVMYILLNLCSIFWFPFWLISLQQYKRAFRGPWDEPKLVFTDEG